MLDLFTGILTCESRELLVYNRFLGGYDQMNAFPQKDRVQNDFIFHLPNHCLHSGKRAYFKGRNYLRKKFVWNFSFADE